MAAALGNNDGSGLVKDPLVLPPGVVCDKCNGRYLSRVEQALIEWPPVSIFRSLGQIRNRKGYLVDAVALTRWDFYFNPKDIRDFVISARGSTAARSRRDDVARALCKILLENRHLEDPGDAYSERWDAVRAAAIGGPLLDDLAMWLTHPAAIEDVFLAPDTELRVRPGSPLAFVGRVHVVGLTFHLFVGTPPPPAWDHTAVWSVDSASGQLEGPGTFWGEFRGRAENARRMPVTPKKSSEATGRNGARLPTHQEGIHIHLRAPDERDD